MKKLLATLAALALLSLAALLALLGWRARQPRLLRLDRYEDKVLGAYAGQCIGVEWGMPTEFKYAGTNAPMPESMVPAWEKVNIDHAFDNDDLYLDAYFLQILDQRGVTVSQNQIAVDFANSTFPLWCANQAARDNIRRGISPESSAHPSFHKCGNDIDWQIEADFVGLVTPGQLDQTIELSTRFGSIINYGDGLYAGTFIAALYSEAFFETNIIRLVQTALTAIPHESDYAQMVRNLLQWHAENPDDWQQTFHHIVAHYARHNGQPRDSNGGIDARLNGAMVLMGILHGNGDIEKTAIIAMRGGFDSDCNPSTALGVLGAIYGYKALPERYTARLSRTKTFANTSYTLPGIVKASTRIAAQILLRNGGQIKGSPVREAAFVIPRSKPNPGPYTPTWTAQPQATPKLLPAQDFAQIRYPSPSIARQDPRWKGLFQVQHGLDLFAPPEWSAFAPKSACADHCKRECFFNNQSWLVRLCSTDPVNGISIRRKGKLTTSKDYRLLPLVATASTNDAVRVRLLADGKELLNRVYKQGPKLEELPVDITPYVGKEVALELNFLPEGQPHGTAYIQFK